MRRMTKIIVDEADHEQTVEILLTHGKNIQTKTNASPQNPPQNTNDRTFHGCGQFFYSDNFTLIKQI